MAYMSQTEKTRLAPAIKNVLKKYGMKGTVAVRNHSTLVVNISEGKMDIIGNAIEVHNSKDVTWWGGLQQKIPEDDKSTTYIQVNQHYIDEQYSGEVAAFLKELFAAMRGDKWYDNSDIMTDYFDTAYYMDVNIGQWNKPYRYIPQ